MISEEEKKKLIKKVETCLDNILKDHVYLASITIMGDYKTEKDKATVSGFVINKIGNIDLLNAPFAKVNAILQSFANNAQSFVKSKYMGNASKEDKE